MTKLSKFQKTLIGISTVILFLLISIYMFFNPPPWKSWEIGNVAETKTMEANLYFSTKYWWCGDLQYENDTDCEFALLVQNPESDTLFYEVMKNITGKPKYGKKREFYIGPNKHLTIKYIPVNVPENTNIRIFFSTSRSCGF